MIRLTRIAAAAALAAATALPAGAFDIDAMTEAERTAFGDAVRAYLLENPEVIMDAVSVLEARQAAAQDAADADLIAANAEALFDDGVSWVGGNPDGDVTVVEFLDYRCGYCRRAVSEVEQLLETDGNVRFVVKEFPILGEDSVRASRFAIAARNVAGDDAYKAVHDRLMAHQGAINDAALGRLARDAELDAEAILAAMDDEAVTQELRANRALAETLQINGTPAFVMEDRVVRGYVPYDRMQAIVDSVRADG
jgi:protein-disulfide isomerase